MHFQARHVTRYRYSRPVWCEPLTVRLKPRSDYRQRLLSFDLDIDPVPKGRCDSIDLEGNEVTTAWFEAATDFLTVTTSFEAETEDVNPFQFVLRPTATRIPLVAPAEEQRYFELYAKPLTRSKEVDELVHRLAQKADFRTVEFLCGLNDWIHAHHEKILRPSGSAWEPQLTLREGRGACRDLAVLFVEACRVLNIPSRFVSGYGASLDETTDRELHAWAEVYLPGAGWRGFDPSVGLAVAERHLAVAVAAISDLAAPTSGTFRGEAHSSLESEIAIEATPARSI
jgi:transglutaminase-like putative cysteine protease